MRVSLLDDNLLASGTVLTSANAFLPGYPAANLFDADPQKRCRLRGGVTVTASVDDQVRLGGGTVTLTAGDYLSVGEYCAEVARAVSTLNANSRCYWEQGSTNRYRIVLVLGSADTLGNATTTRNTLTKIGGFRAENRASATTHTGDFAVTMGGQAPMGNRVLVDLGTAQVGQVGYLVAPDLSPGGVAAVSVGSTTATADATYYADHAPDTEILAFDYESDYGRYVGLRLADPRREDAPTSGAAYWFHGHAWDSAEAFDATDWHVRSYRWVVEQRTELRRGVLGHHHPKGAYPGQSVVVDLGGSIEPSLLPQLQNIIRRLGRRRLAIVALDPQGEPHRRTFLGYLADDPTPSQSPGTGPLGGWSLQLRFRVLEVR